jgi:hypothetical protein
MPTIQTINPDTQSVTLNYGLPLQLTFSPTTPAGAVFNTTGYTVTPVLAAQPTQANQTISTAPTTTPTVGAVGSTGGITITLTAAQVNTLIEALFGLPAAGQFTVNDSGGDTLIAWQGNIRCNVSPVIS